MRRCCGWIGKRNAANKIAYDSIDMQGDIHDDVGPPIFVIAEELNATIEECGSSGGRSTAKGRRRL